MKEKEFVEKNLNKEDYERAKKVDPNLWKHLTAIDKHFANYSQKCENMGLALHKEIIDAKELKFIHSTSRRVKDIISLLVKISNKKSKLSRTLPSGVKTTSEEEKYRDLDEENYYKIITDLSGIRIITRYQREWEKVDNWVRKNFTENYVSDWIKDYNPNPGKNFLAEKPKIYYKYSEKEYYGQFDRKKFELHESKEGYNSIHYIINYQGVYIELQVRTILDEAWGECTHDVIYKNMNENDRLLKLLAQCLSEQMKAAETITEIFYEKKYPVVSQGNKDVSNNTILSENSDILESKKRFGKRLDSALEKERKN